MEGKRLKMTTEDSQSMAFLLQEVEDKRRKGVKVSMEADFTFGRVKAYHMGTPNPIIRLDVRMNHGD